LTAPSLLRSLTVTAVVVLALGVLASCSPSSSSSSSASAAARATERSAEPGAEPAASQDEATAAQDGSGLAAEVQEAQESGKERVEALADARESGAAGVVGTVRHVHTPGWANERVWAKHTDDWEPALAASPNSDRVYALTTRFRTRACKNCPSPAIMLHVSKDGGKSWGTTRYLCRCAGSKSQYDPMIEVSSDGVVHAAWLNGYRPGASYARSADGGRTWTKPVAVDAPWSDKPALAVSSDGQDVYLAFNGATRGDSWMAQSHDGGSIWSTRKVVKSDRYFFAGAGVVAPNGDVVFAENTFNQHYTGKVQTVVERSTNGGATWKEVVVDTTAREPNCPSDGCYLGFYGSVPWIASDANSDLVAIYAGVPRRGGIQHVYVQRSTDNGKTWRGKQMLSDPRALAVFEASVGYGDGKFRAWFMDRRTGRFNVWFRSSNDSGRTWSAAKRISNATAGADYLSKRGFDEAYGDYGDIGLTRGNRVVGIWGEGPSYVGPGGTWFNRQR
jgi:BNR repeat-like domain